MENQIVPVLNWEEIQKKANEAAMKGAISCIEEYYTGYHSPFKKQIEEILKNKGIDVNFDLPDVVAIINERLSAEIDRIANAAIANTYIPQVTKLLTRAEKEVKFSDILEKFVKCTDFDADEDDMDDYTVEYKPSSTDSFCNYIISNKMKDIEYRLHFYTNKTETTLIALPTDKSPVNYNKTMTLSIDKATLTIPFTKGVLEDDFMSYCAGLVLANSNIIFDTTEFNDSMFPEKECHC